MMLPRTKHIELTYYHFTSKVKQGSLSIQYMIMYDQMAHLLTKALGEAQFLKLREIINGY